MVALTGKHGANILFIYLFHWKCLANRCRAVCISSFVMMTAPLIRSGSSLLGFLSQNVSLFFPFSSSEGWSCSEKPFKFAQERQYPACNHGPDRDCHWPIKVPEPDGYAVIYCHFYTVPLSHSFICHARLSRYDSSSSFFFARHCRESAGWRLQRLAKITAYYSHAACLDAGD